MKLNIFYADVFLKAAGSEGGYLYVCVLKAVLLFFQELQNPLLNSEFIFILVIFM